MISKLTKNSAKQQYIVKITDKNGKSFIMTVAGNLDLYWIPQNRDCCNFEIDSSDGLTFSIFDQLFDAIQKVDDKYCPILTNNTITFVSEDRLEDYANILRITREKEKIILEFINNKTKDEFGWVHIGNNICFCNSGSRVPEVEHVFMEMFNKLAYEINLDENDACCDKEL